MVSLTAKLDATATQRALAGFFDALSNANVTTGTLDALDNMRCVAQCVPVCTQPTWAHDVRACLLACRDVCLDNHYNENVHMSWAEAAARAAKTGTTIAARVPPHDGAAPVPLFYISLVVLFGGVLLLYAVAATVQGQNGLAALPKWFGQCRSSRHHHPQHPHAS